MMPPLPKVNDIEAYLIAGVTIALIVACYVGGMIVLVTVLAAVSREFVQFLSPMVEDDVIYGLAVLWALYLLHYHWRAMR